MAQKRAVLVDLLKYKISLVTAQKEELHVTIDTYVNTVLASATSVLESEDHEPSTIGEMSSKLETVLQFLLRVSANTDEATTKTSSKSMEGLKEKTATIFSDKLNDHESRLAALERLSGRTNTAVSKKVEERTTKATNQMHEQSHQLAEKFTIMEKQCSTRIDEMEEKLKQMNMKGVDMMKQSDSRVEKLEKRVKKMESGDKHDASRIDNLEKEVDLLKTRFARVGNLEKEILQFKQETEGLISNLGMMAEKADLIDVMKSTRKMAQSLEELSARVDAIESYENKRRELEDKVSVMKSQQDKNLEDHSKKLADVESKFQQVCQIVDDRVTPLRRLLRILQDFHKRVESRETISQKLDEMVTQVADISARVSKLDADMTIQRCAVGFTALILDPVSVTADTRLTGYSDVSCNEGGHFDPTTGIFTAPRDGLYGTFISHLQEGEGEIGFYVCQESSSDGGEYLVCLSVTTMNGASCCGFGVARLTKGDKLYVKVKHVDGTPTLVSSFSCFAIA